MPQVFYNNFYINNPFPQDGKYMKQTLQGYRPYESTTEVNTTIPYNHRNIGLTVLIDDGTQEEYWYLGGVEDEDLVIKHTTSGGGGTTAFTTILNENPSGVKDGFNLVFTTEYIYASGMTSLYLNGQRLSRGASFDYEETGTNQITFIEAPLSTDRILIDYIVGTPAGGTNFNETPSGILDGTNTLFTTVLPYITNRTRLYLNGQRLYTGAANDYVESGSNEITFNIPPESTDKITIDYDY